MSADWYPGIQAFCSHWRHAPMLQQTLDTLEREFADDSDASIDAAKALVECACRLLVEELDDPAAPLKRNKAVASNLLDQNFSAEAPNEKWAADISYIWTAQGWLYLAVMLDLYSRRVIGWAVGARMTSDLPLRALNRAVGLRQPGAGVIHHSDSDYLRAGSLGVT